MKSLLLIIILTVNACSNPITPDVKETAYVWGFKVTKTEIAKTRESPAIIETRVELIKKKFEKHTPSIELDEPAILPSLESMPVQKPVQKKTKK